MVMRSLSLLIVAAAISGGVAPAHSQTVKSAVYIDLESFVSTPSPTYSGISCSGNCATTSQNICTAIGYKYGTATRMINNSELGGIVCFDTIGISFSLEDGKFIRKDANQR
jgi:hypothetical protein